MADYQKCIPIVLKFEGGLTDDKYDSGGITNFGVSLAFAKDTNDLEIMDKNQNGKIDRNDIVNLEMEDAVKMFKKYFWDRFGSKKVNGRKVYISLDEIESDKKAMCVFDILVNSGHGNAARLSQRALAKLGYDITVDGAIGPITFKCIQDADEEDFCKMLLDLREAFYRKIVENRPNQKCFLKGWLNRNNQLKKIIANW